MFVLLNKYVGIGKQDWKNKPNVFKDKKSYFVRWISMINTLTFKQTRTSEKGIPFFVIKINTKIDICPSIQK